MLPLGSSDKKQCMAVYEPIKSVKEKHEVTERLAAAAVDAAVTPFFFLNSGYLHFCQKSEEPRLNF